MSKVTRDELEIKNNFLQEQISNNEKAIRHLLENDAKINNIKSEKEEIFKLKEKIDTLERQLNRQEDIMTSTGAMMYKAILTPGKEYIVKTESYFDDANPMKIKIININNDIITYISHHSKLESMVNLKNFMDIYTILEEVNEEKK